MFLFLSIEQKIMSGKVMSCLTKGHSYETQYFDEAGRLATIFSFEKTVIRLDNSSEYLNLELTSLVPGWVGALA